MLSWVITWGVACLFDAGWAFVGSLLLAVFFPRLTKILFATVVFPVYALFFGTWAFIFSWLFGWSSFAFEVWTSFIFWTAVPVGLISIYFANAVGELAKK